MRRSVFARDTKRTQEADLAWLPQRRHLILWVCVCFLLSVFFVFRIFCSFFFEVKVCQCHSHSFPFAFVARHRERQQQNIRTAAQFSFLASHCESDPVLQAISSSFAHLTTSTSQLRYILPEIPTKTYPQFIDSACWRKTSWYPGCHPRLWLRTKRISILGHKP